MCTTCTLHAHYTCILTRELAALLLTQECKLASERLGVQVFLDAVDDTVAPRADDGSPSASDSDSEVEGYGLHPRATEGGEEGYPARKGLWRVLKKSIARRDGGRSSTSLRELRAAMRSGALVDDLKGLSPCYTPWMQRHAHPLATPPFLGELVDDLELGLSEDSDLASDEEGLRPALTATGGAAPAPAAAGKSGGSFLEVVMQAQLHT